MKRETIFLGMLIMILSIGVAEAELIITPNPITVNAKVGETKNFSVTLQNTFNFKIGDFTFSDLDADFTIPAIELEPNQSKTIQMTVNSDQAGLRTIQSTVAFKYTVDLPTGETTRHVNITSSIFNPDVITIRKGDTVIWTNIDDITRTVIGQGFDMELQPNQSQGYQFNQVGTFTYFDEVLFFGGTVNVLNDSEAQKVNNPDYNKVWTVSMEITTDPTELVATTTIERNLTINANGKVEGVLEVTNNGSVRAQNVRLTSDPNWIKYNENNFELEVGEKNILTYSVEPLILATDETNKTYTLDIIVKGLNTPEVKIRLNVFVPFSDVFDDITTNEGFLTFFARYCAANPNLIVCNNTISSGGNGSVQVIDPEVNVNLSTREVLAMLRRIQTIEDSNQRTNNELKIVTDLINSKFPEFANLLNESYSKQIENETSQLSKSRVWWIAAIFIMIWIAILVVAFYVRRYYSKVQLMDGGLQHRF